MKWLIAAIYIALFGVYVHITVLNNMIAEHATETLHDSLESASHAASLMVIPSSVANGTPTFDQSEADQVFKKTLAANLDLDSTTLQPLPNSVFQTAPVINLEQFFDYSNTTFPYTYINPTYNIDVTLKQPAIVYAVTIPVPRYFQSSLNYPLIWTDVESYPDHL